MSTILVLILDHQWFINSARSLQKKKTTQQCRGAYLIQLTGYVIRLTPSKGGELPWSQDQASSQINNQLKLTSGQQRRAGQNRRTQKGEK